MRPGSPKKSQRFFKMSNGPLRSPGVYRNYQGCHNSVRIGPFYVKVDCYGIQRGSQIIPRRILRRNKIRPGSLKKSQRYFKKSNGPLRTRYIDITKGFIRSPGNRTDSSVNIGSLFVKVSKGVPIYSKAEGETKYSSTKKLRYPPEN